MSTAHLVEPHLSGFQEDYDAMRHELAKVLVGHSDIIEMLLTAAVAGGHILIEGVPGLGKTVLVQTLAEIAQLRNSRIQFTPDLTPSDLLGTYVVMENAAGRRTFEFQQGPIFSNLVFADHINRGLPKSQSALLQAMEGEEINVSTETFHLPQPFIVIGTQNPLEMEGTFPLPEAELDRFFFKLVMKAPNIEEIDAILLDRSPARIAPRDRRQTALGIAGDCGKRRIAGPGPPLGCPAHRGHTPRLSAGARRRQALCPLWGQPSRRAGDSRSGQDSCRCPRTDGSGQGRYRGRDRTGPASSYSAEFRRPGGKYPGRGPHRWYREAHRIACPFFPPDC